MKFNLISDIHADFDMATTLHLEGGDTLLIAGDLCEVGAMQNHNLLKKLKEEFKKYDKVISVMGNHEHYNGNFNTSAELYLEFLPDVTLLDNTWITLSSDAMMFGATLWSDTSTNPCINILARIWSDYKHIMLNDDNFTINQSQREYEFSLYCLKEGLKKYSDKKIIIMTHFAPSSLSVSDRWKGNDCNIFFHSALEELILDNPNIVVWCHGHMHNRSDYMIGNCRVMCNPRGYITSYGVEETGFDNNFSFEL